MSYTTTMYKRGEVSLSTITIVGIVGLLLLLPAFAIGMVAMMGGNANANPNGTSQQQLTDPTDPQVSRDLATIRSLATPEESLRNNEKAVDDLLLQLNDLESSLEKRITDKDDLQTARTLINSLRGNLEALKTAAQNPDTSSTNQQAKVTEIFGKMTESGTKLYALTTKYAFGASAGREGAVRYALALVQRNNYGEPVNGQHVVDYATGMVPELSASIIKSQYSTSNLAEVMKTVDCSGFVSFSLVASHVADKRLTTSGFVTEIGTSMTNLNSLLDIGDAKGKGAGDGAVQSSEIRRAVEQGILQPGDIILSGMEPGSSSHAMMIVGSGSNGLGPILFDDESRENRSIVQSTSIKGTNLRGPMPYSLAKRIKKMNGKKYDSSAYFLRPTGY